MKELSIKRSKLLPEDITVIDPCMGSGHILVYAFDVLIQIYESYGYSKEDAAVLIIQNNLYGLDVDDRAYQLAYFSVMMKARQYNHKVLDLKLKANLYSIPDSCNITDDILDEYNTNFNNKDTIDAYNALKYLLFQFRNGKNIGSLLKFKSLDYSAINAFLKGHTINLFSFENTHDTLKKIVNVAEILSKKFSVVLTNPPYMGSSGMNDCLLKYVKDTYPDSKSDLFACFIERCISLTCDDCYTSMITQHAWMFLTSYSKLRSDLKLKTYINMCHLGARAFEEISGEVVQTTSFVIMNRSIKHYLGRFFRLIDYDSQDKKEEAFLLKNNEFLSDQENFDKIPNSPVAYWVSKSMIDIFSNPSISEFGKSCIGMRTGDNARFLRLWFEVNWDKIGIGYKSATEACASEKKWFPYCKGGSFRKWYGNNEYVVNWENDGEEIKENTRRVYPNLGDNLSWKISNEDKYFMRGITWSGVGASVFGVRCYPEGMLFDSGANGFFVFNNNHYEYFAGLLNCKIIDDVIKIINPTINTGCGVIADLPAILSKEYLDEVTNLVKQNISIAKHDWDLSELSWDFVKNPIVCKGLIKDSCDNYQLSLNQSFNQLKTNEERLNDIFISIYGLKDDYSSDVDISKISLTRYKLKQVIVDLISYSVGCMFGRYSLDTPGLCCSGQSLNSSSYSSFIPDLDNIIPINDDEYFGDDIVTYFCNFIKVAFGSDYFDENLKFIVSSLEIKGSGTPREKIRKYFLTDFYKNHLLSYQKRPIYWMFDSGKANGFKALIYVHRYTPDLIGKMRKNYLHRMQHFYTDQIKIETDQVRRTSLQKKLDEISRYDLAMELYALKNVEIDLDDGVKHNYALFQNIENSRTANDKINLLYKI